MSDARAAKELLTARLRLRSWKDADRAPFAAMNADPAVMQYFPALLSAEDSNAMVDRCNAHIRETGWGLWAVDRRDSDQFIGFVGLAVPKRVLPFSACVEVGWRLAPAQWRQGFATEAARACLQFAFEVLALREIVAFTALDNRRSRSVMERIGMRDAGQDFDHPSVPEGHPLQRHCLYRVSPWT